MFSNVFPIAAFFAGVVSVLSPCILSVIPAVFAYSTEKGKFRPLAIVLGLSISFTCMGIITSILGTKFTAYLSYLTIVAEILLITMAITLLFDLNTFNIFGNFSSLANSKREGSFWRIFAWPLSWDYLASMYWFSTWFNPYNGCCFKQNYLWGANAFHLFPWLFHPTASCCLLCKLFFCKASENIKIWFPAKKNYRFNYIRSRLLYDLPQSFWRSLRKIAFLFPQQVLGI